MDGWVKLHRKLLDWEWYSDSNMVHLYLHLVLSANHEDKSWRGQTIKRGQLITGRKSLSLKTGISERSIRTCLDRLKATNEVTIKTTNKNSVITVLNYDLYQIKDTKRPTKRPTNDQQTTTNKNDKNIKNNNTSSFEVALIESEKSNYNQNVKNAYRNFMMKVKEHCPTVMKSKKNLNIKTYYDLVSEHGEKKIGLKIEALDLYLEENNKVQKDFSLFLRRCMLKDY